MSERPTIWELKIAAWMGWPVERVLAITRLPLEGPVPSTQVEVETA